MSYLSCKILSLLLKMSEDESVEITQSFWGIIVKPGQKAELDIPDDAACQITNASLALLDTKAESEPCNLIAHVKEVACKTENPSENTKDVENYDSLICQLTPNKCEQATISQIFSQFSEVVLENQGKYDIHVSGIYHETPAEEEEEDIPEGDSGDDKDNDE